MFKYHSHRHQQLALEPGTTVGCATDAAMFRSMVLITVATGIRSYLSEPQSFLQVWLPGVGAVYVLPCI